MTNLPLNVMEAGKHLDSEPTLTIQLCKPFLSNPSTPPATRTELHLLSAKAHHKLCQSADTKIHLDAVEPQHLSISERTEYHLLAGHVAREQGDLTKASSHYHEASELAHEHGNHAGQADALSGLAHLTHLGGDDQTATELLWEVIEHRKISKDINGQVRAICNLASMLNNLGEISKAIQTLSEGEHLLPDCQRRTAIHLHATLGLIHEQTGDLNEAFKQFMLARSLAKQEKDSLSEAVMTLNAGEIARNNNRQNTALHLLKSAVKQASTLQHPQTLSAATHNLGLLYAQMGRTEAQTLLQHAAKEAQKSGDIAREIEAAFGLAQYHTRRGEKTASLSALNEALHLAQQHSRVKECLKAHEQLAEMLSEDDPHEAITHFRAAAALQQSLKDAALVQQARTLTSEAELSRIRREVQYERSVRASIERSRHEAITALENGKLYDQLTGLPNRVLMHILASRKINEQQSQPMSIAIIDINRFKQINEAFGHVFGDELLRLVASRLQTRGSSHNIVSRSSNNEFMILLSGSPEQCREQTEQLLCALSEPFLLEQQSVTLSSSAGLAYYPEHGNTLEQLQGAGQTALEEAKKRGQPLQIYEGGREGRLAQLNLEYALGQALEKGEFELHYQPLIETARWTTVSAEALLRWNSSTLGRQSPADFIPALEFTGLIRSVGAWVLKEACSQAAKWQQVKQGMRVSVNLSAKQISDRNLIGHIETALKESGLPPQCLELEITESMMLQAPDDALNLLSHMKRLGVKVLLDDFGTGYSNFSILRDLPVSGLKIDRSFITALEEGRNEHAQVIIQAIVQLARALNMEVTAEGIEHKEEQRILKKLGVGTLQGYLFARPMANWMPS